MKKRGLIGFCAVLIAGLLAFGIHEYSEKQLRSEQRFDMTIWNSPEKLSFTEIAKRRYPMTEDLMQKLRQEKTGRDEVIQMLGKPARGDANLATQDYVVGLFALGTYYMRIHYGVDKRVEKVSLHWEE